MLEELPLEELPLEEVQLEEEDHEEYQYLDLVQKIIDHGFYEKGRNGNTVSLFGASMRFSLVDGKIPILTTKKTAWKTCLKELLWFIRGSTDNRLLQEQGVHIWDGNSSAEYLASRGLSYPEGELGPIYGYQWRNFNGDYGSSGPGGIDQLQSIIDQLKNVETRTSRRLIMTAWNPCQLDQMALPPCHILCQFNVHDNDKLSCSMYQRSGDIGLGVPFNIASYSFLTHLIAKHCGLVPYEFVYFLGNAHIYDDHLEQMKLQMNRKPYLFPTVEILKTCENIEDYQVADFVIHNYQSCEKISMNMRV
jgi:thymidylate synthase